MSSETSREISIVGFPKCGTSALIRALENEPGVAVLRGANGSVEVAPGRLEELRNEAPECEVLAHKFAARIYMPNGFRELLGLNPEMVIVLCHRNPLRSLISWHKMHQNIARTGHLKNHFAYKERDFYAEADVNAYYYKYARERLGYDHYLQKLLDTVSKDRILVVAQEDLALAVPSFAKGVVDFSRDGIRRPVYVSPDNKPHMGYADQKGMGMEIPQDILDELEAVSSRMQQILTDAGVAVTRSDRPASGGETT